jgi:hypothetical protein
MTPVQHDDEDDDQEIAGEVIDLSKTVGPSQEEEEEEGLIGML